MKKKLLKVTALVLAINLLLEPILVNYAYALTSGPTQPEFSSFEPVATTNMVNEFSGDFTYNLPVLKIPGPDGAGYELSMSYHSNNSPEEEASWIGYGWTLNPGSIQRNKKGIPDDFKGQRVIYKNKVPKNWTVTSGAYVGFELFSIDNTSFGLDLSASLRYNNYKGFGYVAGVGVHAKGIASLGYSVSDGEGRPTASVSPAGILSKLSNNSRGSENRPENNRIRDEIQKRTNSLMPFKKLDLIGSNYGIFSFSEAVRPTQVNRYNGFSTNVSFGLEGNPSFLPLGVTGGLTGNYTEQSNEPVTSLKSFGYMYLGNTDSTHVKDYYVEKESPFQKRDKFLAIPFSNADNFSATGEGVSGGFRLYNKKTGHFTPTPTSSQTFIGQLSIEIEAGPNFGAGGDLGLGMQELSVNRWGGSSAYEFNETEGSDEPYFFRFNNDLGGNVLQSANDNAVSASMTGGGIPGFKNFEPVVSTNLQTEINNGSRSGRSSYIGFHTNTEMAESIMSSGLGRNINYKSYSKDASIRSNVKRDGGAGNIIKDGVGEMAVYNEEGQRYVYGLPVYSRNEKNLQYGLKGTPATGIVDNYLAYRDLPSSEIEVGEERPAPYAASYLLTEITTPDYIDRTLNGPTPDDFGGYTKFNYTQVYGTPASAGYKNTGSNWYKWRIPYTGLHYEKNELSNPEDDLGAVMAGEKEIYYLSSIETRTHIAVFETSDRLDGVDAAEYFQAAADRTSKGTARLKKLDKIRLYARNEDGSTGPLVKTVCFQYDYSLAKGLPNTMGTLSEQTGKLTLKKVWFESENIVNYKINPYVFGYDYKPFGYPTRYASLDNYGNYTASAQNPNYDPKNIDRWGNYQYNGGERHANLNPWVNQNPDSRFDPGAWQLKSIRLPSGGEIHVQYEQDDYSYVQDKPAMAMMSLKPSSSDSDEDNKYYLNTTDWGVTDLVTNPELIRLRDLIQSQFVNTQEKIFFKFLYALIGNSPDVNRCNSEYVTGYGRVQLVGIDGGGLFVRLKEESGSRNTPKKVCVDLVKTTKGGMLDANGNCDASAAGIRNDGNAAEVVMALLNRIGTTIGAVEACGEMNYPKSYIRLPMTRAKKGAGVRVKRLLMFDQGLETGDKVLYGNEYLYQTKSDDGRIISSGVATTEPSTGREENALVRYISRFSQDWFSSFISGEDKKQVEGPIGETILPAPSVGYSKVIAKNIHSGYTNTGIAVHEFYTAKDYPSIGLDENTANQTPLNQEADFLPLPLGVVNRFVNNLWLTQGFRFIVNNMHGQPKATATYGSDYINLHDPARQSLSVKEEYTYYEPGEGIRMMRGANENSYLGFPGKEMEVAMESKTISDIAMDISVELDFSVGILGFIPIPFVSGFPTFSYNENKLSTHVTCKVARYPAIVKEIMTYKDGMSSTTQHLAFNPDNGKPVLTRTFDGFAGLALPGASRHEGGYDSYTIPASHQYEGMGQKAKGEKTILKSGSRYTIIKQGGPSPYLEIRMLISGGALCNELLKFHPGDLIMVSTSMTKEFYHVSTIVGNKIDLLPAYGYTSSASFLNNVNVEIISSGRTNQLNAEAGSIITYGRERTPSVTPIPPAILAQRQAIANAFNASLASGNTTFVIPGAMMYNSAGECKSFPPCTVRVNGNWPQSYYQLDCGGVCNFSIRRSTNSTQDRFIIDPANGQLRYINGDIPCSPQPIPCINFCPDSYSSRKIEGVIAANAQTYDDNWIIADTVTSFNPYETGFKGKWRQKSQFSYRTNIIGANTASERIYKNAGVFQDFILFNWKEQAANDSSKWLKSSTITKYSPHGNPLEERAIDGIYSTAKYGYKNTAPYLIVKNASYKETDFESFENSYTRGSSIYFEDGLVYNPARGTIDNTTAHAGKKSFKLTTTGSSPYTGSLRLKPLTLNPHLKSDGLTVKFWVKSSYFPESFSNLFKLQLRKIDPFDQPLIYDVPFTKIARSGEWTLLEARINSFAETVGYRFLVDVTFSHPYSYSIWMDDIVYHPGNAKVSAYVYEPKTLRLITSFDDQHFGMYYQYNAEGKLIRKLMETEKGVKPIQETQYNTPLTSR